MKPTIFINRETNEKFESNKLNLMPSGIYDTDGIHWLNLIISGNDIIVLSSFGNSVDDELLNDEFEELEKPVFYPVYKKTEGHGDDWMQKNGYL